MKVDFLKRLEEIEKARSDKLSGKFNSIPFGISSLDAFHPGFVRGTTYCITANSGAGKTQTAKWIVAQQPYYFVTKYTDISYKMIWFALEETKEQFMDSLLLNHMHRSLGSFKSMNNLNAYGQFDVLDENELKFLRSEQSMRYYDKLTQIVDIVDYQSDWRFIVKYVYRHAARNGTFYRNGEKVVPTKDDINNMFEKFEFDTYEPNDPNEYVTVVVDHVSLVGGGFNLYESMRELSNKFRLVIGKMFKYIPVFIHQQAKDQGANIERFKLNRILPEANTLADNKSLQNDYLEILGVFQPAASQLDTFSTASVEFPISGDGGFGNRLSFLIPLKSRFNGATPPIPLIFYGEVFMYYPYPKGGVHGNKYIEDGGYRDRFIKLVRDRKYLGEESLKLLDW